MPGIDLCERRARLLGQAFGEVLTLGIVPDILERQHGERDPGLSDGRPPDVDAPASTATVAMKRIPPGRGHRLDKRRSLRRITQRLSNLPHRRVDACLDVDEHVLAPQPVDDLGARDEDIPPLDQQEQQIHRMAFEAHRAAVAAQLVGGDVELEVAEAEGLAGLGHP